MVDDVRLFANEWEIVEQEKMAAEDDLHNPVYAGQSDRIKRLKKKKIWKFIAPLYRLYANVKVRIILICKTSKKEVIGSIVRKVKNKLLSKIMIKRRNKRFIAKITLSKEQLEEQRNTKFSKDVKFSIMVPLYNTPEQFLRDMIGSVQAQTYGNWELCLADGSDAEHAEVGRICEEYAAARHSPKPARQAARPAQRRPASTTRTARSCSTTGLAAFTRRTTRGIPLPFCRTAF